MPSLAILQKTDLSDLDDPRLFREFSYAGGAWTAGSGSDTIDVLDPANGSRIGTVPAMTAADTDHAIAAAHAAFAAWSGRPATERRAILRNWYELVTAAKEDLARLMVQEQGKPLSEARGEIDYAASFIDFYADEALRLGVVSRIAESPVEEALAIAETLCGYGKFGVESTKQVLWANLEASSLEAALHLENRSQILATTSGEIRDALQAREIAATQRKSE